MEKVYLLTEKDKALLYDELKKIDNLRTVLSDLNAYSSTYKKADMANTAFEVQLELRTVIHNIHSMFN